MNLISEDSIGPNLSRQCTNCSDCPEIRLFTGDERSARVHKIPSLVFIYNQMYSVLTLCLGLSSSLFPLVVRAKILYTFVITFTPATPPLVFLI